MTLKGFTSQLCWLLLIETIRCSLNDVISSRLVDCRYKVSLNCLTCDDLNVLLVRTALLAIIGFMPTHGNGAIGSLDYTPEERKLLARK